MAIWFLDQGHWRWWIVSISALTCASIFFVVYLRTRQKCVASEVTAICHHITVVLLASICVIMNRESIVMDSVLSQSSRFALANTIQWINIGYFLYDSVHAVVWEHSFIIHHAVALLGFGISDQAGVGGLSNAVNTLIAEIGSIAYNIYNKNQSKRNYVRFVFIYAASRLVFLAWSVVVFLQVRDRLSWSLSLPVLAVTLQIIVVVVNVHFLSVHVVRLRRILARGQRDDLIKQHLA
jgi:hypothetical protein